MPDDSVLGGLEEMASAGWNATEHGAEAVFDAAAGAGATVATGGVGLAAGAAYAVGAYDTASSLDATRQSTADDAIQAFGDASREAGQAETDVFGN